MDNQFFSCPNKTLKVTVWFKVLRFIGNIDQRASVPTTYLKFFTLSVFLFSPFSLWYNVCIYLPLKHSLFPPAVCVRALDVTASQSSVQVARGQAAILPCSFTTSAALNNLNIIWMVIPLSNANQPEQVWIIHPQTGCFNFFEAQARIKTVFVFGLSGQKFLTNCLSSFVQPNDEIYAVIIITAEVRSLDELIDINIGFLIIDLSHSFSRWLWNDYTLWAFENKNREHKFEFIVIFFL